MQASFRDHNENQTSTESNGYVTRAETKKLGSVWAVLEIALQLHGLANRRMSALHFVPCRRMTYRTHCDYGTYIPLDLDGSDHCCLPPQSGAR